MNGLNENQKVSIPQDNQSLDCPSAVEQGNIKEQSSGLPPQTSQISPDFSNSQSPVPPPYIPPFSAAPSFDALVSPSSPQSPVGDFKIPPQPSVYSQPISQIQPSSDPQSGTKLKQQPLVSPQASQVPPASSQSQPSQQAQFQTSVSSPYPSVSPPQPLVSDVSVRTAASDQESLKQSGGMETTAKFFSPTDLEPVDLRTEIVFTAEGQPMAEGQLMAEGQPKPGETSDIQKSQQAFAQEPASSNKKQKLLIVSLIVLSVIGIAAVFYFFIIPNLLKSPKIEPANDVLQEPLSPAPAVEE